MISFIRATEKDHETIIAIGNISVLAAHKDSASAADLEEYMKNQYNEKAIKKELSNPGNIYHILYYNEEAVGFSKIVLNAAHAAIADRKVTKLDRLYLLPAHQDKKLGIELLQFNIAYAKEYEQSGIWLFTWVGNTKAINFYLRAGFRVIGSHQFKISETHWNENHHMLLDLKREGHDGI